MPSQPSLRSQLNQIRLWVRQGRTDAWIAHKLDISVGQLEQFKRDQRLGGEGLAAAPPAGDTSAEAESGSPEGEREVEPARRGRRSGRREAKLPTSYEATFDHGEEGYGLWLDPAVEEDPVYVGHWAGHRAITVTLEPDAITIRRAGDGEERQQPAEGSGEAGEED